MSIEYDRQDRDRAADERVQKKIGQINADAAALDRIQVLLSDPEWDVEDLADIAELLGKIAELVIKTGRTVESYPDDRSTRDRH